MCVVTPTTPATATTTTTTHEGTASGTASASASGAGLRKRVTQRSSTVDTASESESESETERESEQTDAANDDVDIVASFENVDQGEVWRYFTQTSLLRDFVTPSKPWVLVPNGSFMGNFDWVPTKFRVGPWHPACVAYLVVLTLWVTSECRHGFATEPFPDFEPVPAFTWSWYYNVIAFAWTSLQVYRILFETGMGWTSWGMYTIWSWTFTTVRHGLCAAAPFIDNPAMTAFAEHLRFPMLVQATLTFGVWNGVIGPSIYAQMKTPTSKASFTRFFGNPLWHQMHVYNIVYAAINGIWGSPARSLTKSDFAVALLICLVYALFYVLVLDRVGVHYYLVFSPRTPFALISWTFAFGCYYACFPLWNAILTKCS